MPLVCFQCKNISLCFIFLNSFQHFYSVKHKVPNLKHTWVKVELKTKSMPKTEMKEDEEVPQIHFLWIYSWLPFVCRRRLMDGGDTHWIYSHPLVCQRSGDVHPHTVHICSSSRRRDSPLLPDERCSASSSWRYDKVAGCKHCLPRRACSSPAITPQLEQRYRSAASHNPVIKPHTPYTRWWHSKYIKYYGRKHTVRPQQTPLLLSPSPLFDKKGCSTSLILSRVADGRGRLKQSWEPDRAACVWKQE